jgi:dolichyl-phosphate-mannose--protein O-mannosyl transferase
MCYYRQIHDGRFSSITAFGNPALFWAGTASLVYLAYLNIKRRTVSSMFILLAFLGLYLPYIFIGRLMFIYHFYYAVPFMFLALVYSIRDLMHQSQRVQQYLWVYLSIVALLFLAYYPVLSGYEVPKAYVDYLLKWFPWWWL